MNLDTVKEASPEERARIEDSDDPVPFAYAMTDERYYLLSQGQADWLGKALHTTPGGVTIQGRPVQAVWQGLFRLGDGKSSE